MEFWVVFFSLAMIPCSCIETETTDVETFKELMHQLFLQELGEDLRLKLQSISNEGVILGRKNAEIDAMVRSRLTSEEKARMRKAFETIAGSAKDFARQRVKGQPARFTRSSQFKKPPGNEQKKTKNMRNNFDL